MQPETRIGELAEHGYVLKSWLDHAALMGLASGDGDPMMRVAYASTAVETAFQVGVMMAMEYPMLVGPALQALNLPDATAAVGELVERLIHTSGGDMNATITLPPEAMR